MKLIEIEKKTRYQIFCMLTIVNEDRVGWLIQAIYEVFYNNEHEKT